MNIKTWQKRAGVKPEIIGTVGYEGAMQAEIDELRAALLESKDVGLRLLTCRSLFSLARGEINAHRKVLEQALEALNAIHPDFVCQATHHKNKDEHDGFDDCPNVSRHQAAITAIQGVLK